MESSDLTIKIKAVKLRTLFIEISTALRMDSWHADVDACILGIRMTYKESACRHWHHEYRILAGGSITNNEGKGSIRILE